MIFKKKYFASFLYKESDSTVFGHLTFTARLFTDNTLRWLKEGIAKKAEVEVDKVVILSLSRL